MRLPDLSASVSRGCLNLKYGGREEPRDIQKVNCLRDKRRVFWLSPVQCNSAFYKLTQKRRLFPKCILLSHRLTLKCSIREVQTGRWLQEESGEHACAGPCVCVWSQTRAVPCMRLRGYGPSKPHASTRLVLLNAEPRAKGDRPLQLPGLRRTCQPFGVLLSLLETCGLKEGR